jgi:hypothetical protein
VNKLLERGERVLVLIPHSYAQRVVPNNAANKGRRATTRISSDDQVTVYLMAHWLHHRTVPYRIEITGVLEL